MAHDSILISLVIPAWNEAAYLPRMLDSVEAALERFSWGRERVEVIVADNGSTDETAKIAESRGCKVVPVAKRCIAAARNGGAAFAKGELIAFADADFVIHPDSFNFICEAMQRGGYVGGGTGVTMERWSLGIRMTWAVILPMMWLCGLDGGIWFCRRADFELIGGYNEDIRAGEDVLFLRALKKLGKGRIPREKMITRFTAKEIGYKPTLAVASCRKWDKHGEWHMFRDAIVNLPRFLFSPRRTANNYIEKYWYTGRETDGITKK
jgi:glycosyltransferase involved in cell wall biosynthesis